MSPRIFNQTGWGAPGWLFIGRNLFCQVSSVVCEIQLGTWRFHSDLGGGKSPVLGPGFGNRQDADYSGGFWANRVRTRVLGSTLPGSLGVEGRSQRAARCSLSRQRAQARVACGWTSRKAAKESAKRGTALVPKTRHTVTRSGGPRHKAWAVVLLKRARRLNCTLFLHWWWIPLCGQLCVLLDIFFSFSTIKVGKQALQIVGSSLTGKLYTKLKKSPNISYFWYVSAVPCASVKMYHILFWSASFLWNTWKSWLSRCFPVSNWPH